MSSTRRQREHMMTGAEIIELVEKRAAIRATILAARGKVEQRIAGVCLIAIGAAAYRFLGWRAVAALVVYQIATGIRAYRNWKRIQQET